MARLLYGTAPGDLIARVNSDTGDSTPDYGPPTSGQTFTVWTAMTGGTHETDLLDMGNNPVSVITPEPATYRLRFQGKDGYVAAYWLDDGAGNRWRVDPSNLADRVGGVTSVAVNSGTPQAGAVNLQIQAEDIVDATDTGILLMTAYDSKSAANAIGLSDTAINQKIAAYIAANGGTTGGGGSGGGGTGGGGTHGALDTTDPTVFVTGTGDGALDTSDPTVFVTTTSAGALDTSDPTVFVLA